MKSDLISVLVGSGKQIALLDVSVFNPNLKRYAKIKLAKAYKIKHITNAFFWSSMEVSHLW